MVQARAGLKDYATAAFLFAIFMSIGLWRWQATGRWFYIINFGYIGISIAIGEVLSKTLSREHKTWGRRITQLMIGLYMLGFLGLIARVNMQMEGFFFHITAGVLSGASMHYLIAKIAGPFIFGRAWCGWACWTAMVLDFLPWKQPVSSRIRKAGLLRYIHFACSLGLVMFMIHVLGRGPLLPRHQELTWLLTGNILYYLAAITLAMVTKDNRAFCKYLCPIPVVQKLGAGFALMKQKIDRDLCTECGACETHCPMDIQLLEYARRNQRVLSTECILCDTCKHVCPVNAITTPGRFDISIRQYLRSDS